MFKAPKGQKMPYPMLMRQIKRRKEQEKEQRERVGNNYYYFFKKIWGKEVPPLHQSLRYR